jgi:hypothetical protein
MALANRFVPGSQRWRKHTVENSKKSSLCEGDGGGETRNTPGKTVYFLPLMV